MSCPYLKQIVMARCEATCVKKALPADRLVPIGPCDTGDFEKCPLFREALERLQRAAGNDCETAVDAAETSPTHREG